LKVIVTGASGFIGSAFVKKLTDSGVDVLAISRKNYNQISISRKSLLEKATYLQVNMDDIKQLKEKINRIKWLPGENCIFFNLAWGGKGDSLSDLNVEAQFKNIVRTISAYEIANEINCTKFIQVGSMEEIFAREYLKLDHSRDSLWNRHIIYSLAKIMAKNAVNLYEKKFKTHLIYVNHSHIMGPGDDKDSFLQVSLQKLIRGDDLITSTCEQFFDVVSLSDCVNAYYLICTSGIPGNQYWVGSGQPRKLKEYVLELAKLIPSKSQIKFGEMPYNDVTVDLEEFSINTLRSHTGYKPNKTFADSVFELHNYLVDRNNLPEGEL